MDALKEDKRSKDEAFKSASDALREAFARKDANERTAKQLAVLSSSHEQVEKEFGLISALADTASGKLSGKEKITFETYVQTIYFDRVLEAANQRLAMMSDGRYELLRRHGAISKRAQTGLDLDVFDNYTGRARDAASLSGGESFKASLSLALGLSDLNAGTLRVETLFLDEGFGTLDEKALDVAIATLETVRRDGDKSIGLISHVKALDDRLTAKIVAKKRGAGQSELFGPCVRRLPPTPSREKRKTAAG